MDRGVMRSFIVVSVCLLASGVTANASAHGDWLDDCRQVVLDYAYYRDRPDADGVANLFTLDGTFTIGPDTFSSREAIRNRIALGTDGPLFRHMMSTIHIEPVSKDEASGISYATVYVAPPGDLPRQVSAFAALGEYHDSFVREGGTCKIKVREFVRVLVP
jgi:hypothetical protein